jgi:hypothetical protein
MAALNIQIIGSSALHPSGRGHIERTVGIVKTLLKKMLATKPTLNWECLPFLVAKIINNSVSLKTGFKPTEMVFGNGNKEASFLGTDVMVPPHFMVKNNQQHIEQLTKEIKDMTAIATEKLTNLRLVANEKVNKNRITKQFKKYDYVFVLDRLQIPGNTRPLKTKYHPSPYIVIKSFYTTTLVRRLSDGFQSLYSNDDIKKYDATSPLFNNLPPQVSKVLLHDFEHLLDADLCTITRYDKFAIPDGMDLMDPSDEPDVPPLEQVNENINLFDNNDVSQQQQQPSILPHTDPLTLPEKLENFQESLKGKEDIPPIPDTVLQGERLNGTEVNGNNVSNKDDIQTEQEILGTEQDDQELMKQLVKPSKDEILKEILDSEDIIPNVTKSDSDDSDEEQDILTKNNPMEQTSTKQHTMQLRPRKQKSVSFEK